MKNYLGISILHTRNGHFETELIISCSIIFKMLSSINFNKAAAAVAIGPKSF